MKKEVLLCEGSGGFKVRGLGEQLGKDLVSVAGRSLKRR